MPSRISLRKHWISPPLKAHFNRFLKNYTPLQGLSVSAAVPCFLADDEYDVFNDVK